MFLARPVLLTALAAGVAFPASAPAAADSSLKHRCSYKYGAGDYQNVTWTGRTSCSEARQVIRTATSNGRRAPSKIRRTVRLPHSTWRCVTIRRVENKGYVTSTHRTTCDLRNDPQGYRAKIRFFRVG